MDDRLVFISELPPSSFNNSKRLWRCREQWFITVVVGAEDPYWDDESARAFAVDCDQKGRVTDVPLWASYQCPEPSHEILADQVARFLRGEPVAAKEGKVRREPERLPPLLVAQPKEGRNPVRKSNYFAKKRNRKKKKS